MKARLRTRTSRTVRLHPRSQRRIINLRLQGIAAALGELAHANVQPDLALMALDSLGLPVTDLQAAGADPHDAEPLKNR